MESEKLQRFISRQDWISLLAPAPRPHYPKLTNGGVWHDLKNIQTELSDMTEELESLKLKGAQIFDLPGLKAQLRKRHQSKLHRKRLKELSQPKASPKPEIGAKWTWAEPMDQEAGPGDYEVRLDLSKPSFESNRPKQPIPIIKDFKRSDKAFSCKEEIERRKGLDSPACTIYTPNNAFIMRSPSRVIIAGRSASHSRLRPVLESDEDSRHLLRHNIRASHQRDPSPFPKGSYSIPKSPRKFDIRKCMLHIDSLQNRAFNLSFVPRTPL